MQIYLYNIHYLSEFITCAEKADEIPIEPPETAIAPPEAVPNKVWCFDVEQNAWTHTVDDYRGKAIYNCKNSKDAETVKFVGAVKEGWTLIEPPDHENDYSFDGSEWVAVPKVYSKLAIRRACRSLGIESKLNALLAENDVFNADWTDALDIDLNDPVTKQALIAGEFSEDEIAAITQKVNP